jgi:hypothetical protein
MIIKTRYKIFILAILLVFSFFPFVKKFFTAQISTVTVVIPSEVIILPGGGGGEYCGNGSCASSETCGTCLADCGVCPPVCGDLVCGTGETCGLCSADCGVCLPVCGDLTCNGTETCTSCAGDCGACLPVCGDLVCNGTETCTTCVGDCGACPISCGDSICNGTETCLSCAGDCGVCPENCGNGVCSSVETCSSCSADCGICPIEEFCGDSACNNGETCSTCAGDCGTCQQQPPDDVIIPSEEGGGIAESCGNNLCGTGETCGNCRTDCGECLPVCGDNSCDPRENCDSCSNDCGVCQIVIPQIIAENIPPAVVQSLEKASKVINAPQVSVATKIFSTTGAIGGAVATTSVLFFSPTSLFELLLFPLRLLGLLMASFGLKKKRIPWGVVYDSVTKQPLDPAYVVLKNFLGKDILSAITDLDGRYGFLPTQGIYKIFVNKTNYIFPSKKLLGENEDELYRDLYFGEDLQINAGQAIVKNIPLDPVKFDWNEFTKKDKKLMRFFSKWDLITRRISDLFFVLGFAIAIVAYIFAPYPYNTVILGMYLILSVLRILGLRPKPFGSVIEKSTGNPLSFAIIRILTPGTDREVSHKITDKYGRYLCFLPAGKYYLKIEKKNNDGSYGLVYTSKVIDLTKKGIIKERFKV